MGRRRGRGQRSRRCRGRAVRDAGTSLFRVREPRRQKENQEKKYHTTNRLTSLYTLMQIHVVSVVYMNTEASRSLASRDTRLPAAFSSSCLNSSSAVCGCSAPRGRLAPRSPAGVGAVVGAAAAAAAAAAGAPSPPPDPRLRFLLPSPKPPPLFLPPPPRRALAASCCSSPPSCERIHLAKARLIY